MVVNKYLGQLTIIILLFFRANNCMANVGTYSVYTPLLTSSPYAVSGPVSALTYGRSVEIYHPRQQFSTYYSAATPLTAPAMHYLSTQSFVNSLPNHNPLVSDVAATTLTKSVMVREPVKDVKGPTTPITPSVLAVSSASAAAVVPASKQAAEYDSSSAFVAPPVSLPAPTSSSNPSTSYDFSYSVHDSLSGDIKSQVETRQGGNVRGTYSVLDADGYRRTVAYSADDLNGFNAVVQREPFVAKLTDIVNVMDVGHEATTFSVPVQDFKFLSQPSGQQVAFVQQPQQQNEPQSILSQLPESLVSDEKQQQQQHQSTYPQDQQFPPQHHQLEKDDNQQLEQHHHQQQQQQQQQQETGEELSSNPSSNFDDSDVLEVRLATKIDDQKRNPKI